MQINKRGAPPDGGGEVYFTCPVINELKAVDLLKLHKIKRWVVIPPPLFPLLAIVIRSFLNSLLSPVA